MLDSELEYMKMSKDHFEFFNNIRKGSKYKYYIDPTLEALGDLNAKLLSKNLNLTISSQPIALLA